MKKIGIIGGLGAAAGARFYDALVRECQRRGAAADADFPEVVLHGVPSRGLDKGGVADYGVLLQDLSSSVEMLNRCGVDVIAIACNSAHVYHPVLQAASDVEILNMVEIAAGSVGAATQVGVISSATTKESGLYESALAARGVRAIHTTPDQQQMVDGMIERAISGRLTEKHRRKLYYVMRSMLRRGADEIILGCTELPLVGDPLGLCIDAGQKTIERLVEL